MKIESLPNNVLMVVRNNQSLCNYLSRLESGRSMTPRSWLYEGEPAEAVLHRWLTILETVKTEKFGELVYQFDTSQLKKWGPQGGIKPVSELMDLVTEGFSRAGTPKPAVFNSRLWKQAKQNIVEKLFIRHGVYHVLRPRSYQHVIDDMRSRDTLESNSGFPLFARRKAPETIDATLADIASGKYRDYPAILLFRNYNQKTRPVWMYPMSVNLVEGSFTQPLKEAILAMNINKFVFDPATFFMPWRGYDQVKEEMSIRFAGGWCLTASDFSHTDAHFTKWAMFEVFDVIKHAFQAEYWDALKDSMLSVVKIPLIINSKQWIVGDHGVASGSNWTNDVETYFDLIAEEYLSLKNLVCAPFNGIGDDICHANLDYRPHLAEDLAREYQAMDFDVNAEKVTNQRDWVKYLQRLMIRGYSTGRSIEIDGNEVPILRGIYSTIRALNSSLQPEKFHKPSIWNKDLFAARQFMILENCIDHPKFVDFVLFVCKGHPYLHEFACKSSTELTAITRQSRLVPGLNPTYNQEKRDKSLADFESIAIARKLG